MTPDRFEQANYIIQKSACKKEGDHRFSQGNTHKSISSIINFPNFTSRQRDIFDLLLAGHSNKMIGYILNLSYGTVKNYMFDLMRLLSVKSRLELVTKIRANQYQGRHEISTVAVRCALCECALVNDPPNVQLVAGIG
jgi:DNA-binding NarL/FixJ family response regulator